MVRIKEIAKSKGVSLTELAQKLGITYQALNARIIGNPSLKALIEIANVLEVDVRDLIEPTTSTATTPLYIKDDNGNLVEVGSLNKDKE
ncbi:helix-turn-helix domain-containing protein [Capnocytophaga sp. H4358]|uniref:helix-turn-helix domain-containing protein n=1 Tax=Capnocytophaga sp. H4358 TaxID=1945658 RepID=UPI001E2AB5F6|nr:helix-turn-helix transcriptional regulator [Capnocytophaga sp. H4358]